MDFTKVKQSLIKNGFEVSIFENKEDATNYLCDSIQNKTVGIGGSMTILRMGLFGELSKNNEVYWHWNNPRQLDKDTLFHGAACANVYISSLNGVSETGELINIDGTGNRVSAMLFGHEKVFFVVGKNKVEKDFESALYRARNVAAPKNAQRLKCNTPCAKCGDRCYDCDSPDRICRALSVLYKKPNSGKYEVVFINEDLGY